LPFFYREIGLRNFVSPVVECFGFSKPQTPMQVNADHSFSYRDFPYRDFGARDVKQKDLPNPIVMKLR
ncbi:hypothetical protein NUW87_11625, partial [Corynebacterium pilbarense]